MDLIKVIQQLGTHNKCVELLERLRFKDGAYCPYCDSDRVAERVDSNARSGKRWNCHSCKKAFSITVGTMFHNTRIPLEKWLVAIVLEVNAKKSLSACQLQRDIGVNYKTALKMLQRIRQAMLTDQVGLLKGIVEMDETYIGGKPRYKGGKRGRGTKKAPVIGITERHGRIKVFVERNKQLTKDTMTAIIKENVDIKKSVLMTDEFASYKGASKFMPHLTVNHSKKEYAKGQVNTNSIESFWALFTRAFDGQWHRVNIENLPVYVGQMAFKWNYRKHNSEQRFDKLMELMLCQS